MFASSLPNLHWVQQPVPTPPPTTAGGVFLQSINTQFPIRGSALCPLRVVPSLLTGAPQTNDWREVAAAQGLLLHPGASVFSES